MPTPTISSLHNLALNHKVQAVIFDCFGTLMHIRNKQKPYKFLIDYLKNQAYSREDMSLWLMGQSLSIDEIEDQCKVTLPLQVKTDFRRMIVREVESVKVFPEVNELINDLQQKGIKTVMCSNLASPYGEIAKRSTVPLDHYVLSYEVGHIKPQAEIFEICQKKLNLAKEHILFVGDSLKDDYQGSHDYGFQSVWLRRDLHIQK
jgi:HAD superfamily hydrolase (TIGR01549 family)